MYSNLRLCTLHSRLVCAVGKKSYYTKFYTENLKEEEHTKDARIDGRILE